jgi:hypothetical protein
MRWSAAVRRMVGVGVAAGVPRSYETARTYDPT